MKGLFTNITDKLTGPQTRLMHWLDIVFFLIAAVAFFLMAVLCHHQLTINAQITARLLEEGDLLTRFVAREWWLFPAAGLSVLVIAYQTYKRSGQPMISSVALVFLVGLCAVLSGLLVSGVGFELKRLGAW